MSRYRRQVVIYLPPALDEALRRRAELEARSVSKMGEMLLAEALAEEGDYSEMGESRAMASSSEDAS